MVDVPDVNLARCDAWALDLRVTAQAEVEIGLEQQLGVDGAVRAMAYRATFAQRGMLEDERPGLFAVALRASLILACHRQAARSPVNVASVRFVALGTVHFLLQHRVMLRKLKLCLHLEMALKARSRILAGIHNELPASASAFDV